MGREGERERERKPQLVVLQLVKDYDLEESSQESLLVFLEANADETWNGNEW